MNKAQLVETIAERMGSRKAAVDAVDAVLDAIVREVTAGGRVSVTGFGSFDKVDRPARYARNPQNGERVRVKKTSVPRFRAGQGFKDIVAGTRMLPSADGSAVKKAEKRILVDGVLVAPTKTASKKANATKRADAKKTVPPKKAAARVTAKKATTTKKTASKRTTTKKTAVKKAPAKKTAARVTSAKK